MTANLAPGVHVKEVERGAKPIEGVSTSTAGFLGPTERGPLEPKLITSYADFRRIYGGYRDDSYLAPAVEGFFANGGGRAYVGRVTEASEVGETALLAGSGTSEPEPANGKLWPSTEIVDFGDAASGDMRTLTVENAGESGDDTITVASDDLTVEDSDDWTVALAVSGDLSLDPDEEGDIEITYDGPDEAVTGTLTIDHDGTNAPVEVSLHRGPGAVSVTAVGPGGWAENVAVIVEDGSMYQQGDNQLFKLTLRYWADDADQRRAEAHGADPDHDAVPDPDVEEVYDDLSPVQSSSQYYVSVVDGASNLVELERTQPGRPAPTEPVWLDVPDESPADLDSTSFDGDPTLPPDERTGFAGFATVDDISIVCVPDEVRYPPLADSIRTHCTEQGDRVGVLQAPQNPGGPGEVSPSVNSDYTAYYYPWIEIINSETGNEMTVPPGGHVAGIYARSDSEYGVHKAPANEVVRGAQSLQVNLNDQDQVGLNNKGVNCIRSFRGRGIRVWGARTTSPDPSWKYLNVRRLFLYLRESIEEGTQWVVFESNDEDLWARVEQTIENFLTAVWEDGALMGTTPEEAFYVKCDRTTMTQNDIDNGRLICEIGVAPVKPAEFVIFEIGQWTGSAE